MKLERIRLSNGIFYNHAATDRFKTGYLSVNFILPLDKRTAALYALLPDILRRGCRDYPDQASLNRRLEELYGTEIATRNYKRGEMQIIGFAADMLDGAYLLPDDNTDLFGCVASLLGELIFSPLLTAEGRFREDYIESERLNRMDAVRALINNKRRYAVTRCTELMCAEEKSGVAVEGTLAAYEHLEVDRLMECYRYMTEQAQVEVFYVGSCDRSKAETCIRQMFSGRERRPDILLPKTEIVRCAAAPRRYEETTPAVQGNLTIGFRTGTVMGDADYLAYPLFNEIFGGSPASKLFMNVREKLSLCYFCFSHGDTIKGLLYVSAGIENRNKDKAISEILTQLEKIRLGEMTEEELLCARASLFHAYRAISDNPVGVESWYLGRILVGIHTSPEETMAAMERIGREEIAAVARKITLDTVYFLRGSLSDTEEGMEEEEQHEE